MTLSPIQIAQYAQAAGFTGDGLVAAVAVALAESGGDPLARYVDGPGSIDRGLWQISSYFHPEVSDACAYDPACAAAAAYRISRGGWDWTPWATWTNGRAQQFLAEAMATVAQAGYSPTNSAAGRVPPALVLLAVGIGLYWLFG